MEQKVIKRNGEIEVYQGEKIAEAMRRAFIDEGEPIDEKALFQGKIIMSEDGVPERNKDKLSYKAKERKDCREAEAEGRDGLEDAKDTEPEPVEENIVEADSEK